MNGSMEQDMTRRAKMQWIKVSPSVYLKLFSACLLFYIVTLYRGSNNVIVTSFFELPVCDPDFSSSNTSRCMKNPGSFAFGSRLSLANI
uniref:Uncharacterized protein n=1 Tax=Solanum lycopersicum TaxID=4081 RepID=A0A3Q7G5Z0_SOLLC